MTRKPLTPKVQTLPSHMGMPCIGCSADGINTEALHTVTSPTGVGLASCPAHLAATGKVVMRAEAYYMDDLRSLFALASKPTSTSAVLIPARTGMVRVDVPTDEWRGVSFTCAVLGAETVAVVSLSSGLQMWVNEEPRPGEPPNMVARMLAHLHGGLAQAYVGPVLLTTVGTTTTQLTTDAVRALLQPHQGATR